MATPIKLRNGSWGIKVTGATTPGARHHVVAKSGKTWTATVAHVVWSGDGVSICATAEPAQQTRGGRGSCHTDGNCSSCCNPRTCPCGDGSWFSCC
jgi:hypothetical protein